MKTNITSSRPKIARNFIPLLMMLCLLSSAYAEDSLVGTHSASNYFPGEITTITSKIEFSEQPTAIGMVVTLPAGWRFDGVSGVHAPDITQESDKNDTIEFAWITIPQGSFEFDYYVLAPNHEAADQKISSKILYRRDAGELTEDVLPSPLILTRP